MCRCLRLRVHGVRAALRLDTAVRACDLAPSAVRTARTRRSVCVWQTALQARVSDKGKLCQLAVLEMQLEFPVNSSSSRTGRERDESSSLLPMR